MQVYQIVLMPTGHPIILLKSNQFNMAAVSIKRSIGLFFSYFVQLVENNVPPACVKSSMYFWTHTEWESEASHSKRNSHEAKEITRVAEKFCQEGGVHPSKITVLCSYRGQASV